MKLAFGLLALLSLSPFASADLVVPGPRTEKITVSGNEGVNLYDALDVPEVKESESKSTVTSVKVFRADSGLAQMVCHQTVNPRTKAVTGSCTLEKSSKALPKYKSPNAEE